MEILAWKLLLRIRFVLAAVASVLLLTGFQAKTVTVRGYVIDSACTFTQNLKTGQLRTPCPP